MREETVKGVRGVQLGSDGGGPNDKSERETKGD